MFQLNQRYKLYWAALPNFIWSIVLENTSACTTGVTKSYSHFKLLPRYADSLYMFPGKALCSTLIYVLCKVSYNFMTFVCCYFFDSVYIRTIMPTALWKPGWMTIFSHYFGLLLTQCFVLTDYLHSNTTCGVRVLFAISKSFYGIKWTSVLEIIKRCVWIEILIIFPWIGVSKLWELFSFQGT